MTTTPFLPGLSPVETKPLTASQDAGNLSSNGGLIVLREAARRLGLADVIAKHLPDARNPMLVTHTYSDSPARPEDRQQTNSAARCVVILRCSCPHRFFIFL